MYGQHCIRYKSHTVILSIVPSLRAAHHVHGSHITKRTAQPCPSLLRFLHPSCPSLISHQAYWLTRHHEINRQKPVHHVHRLPPMNLESPHSSTCVSGLIEGYTTAASSHYAESPEVESLMFLTAIELWVALDKCSIHQYSLLRKYDPRFPQLLFHPFLLPKS